MSWILTCIQHMSLEKKWLWSPPAIPCLSTCSSCSISLRIPHAIPSVSSASFTAPVRITTQVRIMATRCMTQAVYVGSGEVAAAEYHHYGLAAPLYTHFTSPIRRCDNRMVRRTRPPAFAHATACSKDTIHHDMTDVTCLLADVQLRQCRYADVVVHRLLAASLGLIQLPAQVRLHLHSALEPPTRSTSKLWNVISVSVHHPDLSPAWT